MRQRADCPCIASGSALGENRGGTAKKVNLMSRTPATPTINLHDTSGCELENGFRFYRVINRCRGWQAVITVRRQKYTRYFADAAHGSPEAARRAAKRFASRNKDLHRELLALRRRFEVRKNSRSGLPGVSRYEGDGTHGPFWLAYWDDQQGRRVSRRFSIQRLGEAKALASAVKVREGGVRPFRKRYEQVLASLKLLPDDRDSS